MSLVLDKVSREVAGQVHIRDVSLELARGSLNVLLGATLAGKTTLMRLMAGLDAPTSGRILVEGADVTGVPVKKRSVAMVYQQFINYPSLSVYENIASPLRVAGLGRAEIDRRVQEAAKLLKLEPYMQRRPLELSGGQQQRTAIARALVKRADLVLLDEPLANLDYKLREELREELPRIFAESGAIFVYATTEPTEALLLGGNTATMREGAVTQFGPTPLVYRRPHDLATASVFSDPPINTLRITKAGPHIRLENGVTAPAAGVFASVPDGTYTMGVRAHHLGVDETVFGEETSLSPAGRDRGEAADEGDLPAGPPPHPGPLPGGERGQDASGIIRLNATISVSEITGSESFVHMDVGNDRLIALVPGVRRLEPGAYVDVLIDPGHILLFDPEGRSAGRVLDAAA